MNLDDFLSWAWSDYIQSTPEAEYINELLSNEGEQIVNDHIALRTFKHESCSLEVLEKFFLGMGFERKGEYVFKKKKL